MTFLPLYWDQGSVLDRKNKIMLERILDTLIKGFKLLV